MPLKWDDSLLIGVELIDRQHQELFKLINYLLDQMDRGEGRNVLRQVYNNLGKYIIEHFETEESLMIKTGYGEYLHHLTLHRKFCSDFYDYREELNSVGATTNLLIDTETWLTGWWMNHIRNVDQRLGSFLKSHAA